MTPRIGIGWRLALIVVAALIVVQLAAVAAYMAERRDATRSALGPQLPGQIAALVHLADDRSPEERALIAAATAGPGVRVSFPERVEPASLKGREIALFETLVRRALGDPDRPVRVDVARGLSDDGVFNDRGAHVRVVVPLHGGGQLDFAAGRELTARLFGLPVGLLAGIFGLVVALVAVMAIAREAKPLIRLAKEVDGLGENLRRRPLDETGAPEVRHLVQAINRMQARIATLVEARTLTLSAIAHDLGTAMTRLRLRLEFLAADPMRDRAIKDLEDMARLVDDGHAFARSTAEVDHEDLDLTRIVTEACCDRIDLGAPVRLGTLPPSARLTGSRIGLTRLVGNLVDNALRYAGDAEVAVSRAGDAWELTVSDHGPGIAPDDRLRVFEPFLRLEASRNRATGGSGLGLAIAHQVVTAHGGTIEIQDRPDGASGTVIAVRLPI